MSASVSVSVPESVPPPSVGVWLIGARGSVATTVVAGCAALTAGLHAPTGLVTETPVFAEAGLPPFASLVFGGHDTLDCPLPKRAEALAAGGVLPPGLPTAVAAELAAADREIRPGGPTTGDTRTEEELIASFAADMTDFVRRCGLSRAVVVNVASTEPRPRAGPSHPARCTRRRLCARAARTSTSPRRRACTTPRWWPPRHRAVFRTRAVTARRARRFCAPSSARCSRSAPWRSAPGPAPTCSAAATAPPWPTRPPPRPRTRARNASSPTLSPQPPRARSTSTTFPRSATGRPPGTTSPSTASSAPA